MTRFIRRRRHQPFSKQTYMEHACFSEAYSAHMYGANPGLSEDAKRAYKWAEDQFVRIAKGKVGEGDLIG